MQIVQITTSNTPQENVEFLSCWFFALLQSYALLTSNFMIDE